MNPAKAFAHLFSPLGGDDGDNYRSPGQISFLRAPFVSLDGDELANHEAPDVFIGVPFDEGNVGKPGWFAPLPIPWFRRRVLPPSFSTTTSYGGI